MTPSQAVLKKVLEVTGLPNLYKLELTTGVNSSQFTRVMKHGQTLSIESLRKISAGTGLKMTDLVDWYTETKTKA